jgi:hypothetical protein
VKRIVGSITACTMVVAALVLAVAPGRAAAAAQVSVTFELTINGTPPSGDSFAIAWGETGLPLCSPPCQGGGHTYRTTMLFPKGVTETFAFTRGSGHVTPAHPAQRFGVQRLTLSADRTISAVFTYATPSVATPSAGAGIPVVAGGAVSACGVLLLLVARPRRPRPRAGTSLGPC